MAEMHCSKMAGVREKQGTTTSPRVSWDMDNFQELLSYF